MGPPSKRPELREMTGCRYQRLYFGTSTLLRAGDGPADQEKVRRRWHWSTDERRQGCHTERPKNNKLVRWGTLWEPPPPSQYSRATFDASQVEKDSRLQLLAATVGVAHTVAA